MHIFSIPNIIPMARKKKEDSIKTSSPLIFKILLFLVAAALIVLVYPREGRFRYQFQEGKPWRYGLLTAPHNFSIYKTEETYQAEKDSILTTFKPYVQQDAEVYPMVIEKLQKDYASLLRVTVPHYYVSYLVDQLELIYKAGIVPATTMNDFEKKHLTSVYMVIDKVSESRDITTLFTTKRAYSALLQNLPENIEKEVLIRECKIENYLQENCMLDETTSDIAKKDLLRNVSQTYGLVQRGERIIDQGEIVNHETFLKLSSLKRTSEERNDKTGGHGVLIGQIVWVLSLMTILFIYLQKVYPEIFAQFHNILFLLILMVLLVLLTALVIRNDAMLNIYMIPYAILPVMICTFFNQRLAFFVHTVTVMMCATMAPFPFEFIMLQIPAGIVSIFSVKELTQRSQLILCIFWVFITYSITYTGIAMLQEGAINQVQWKMYVFFGINSVLMLSAYLLIYLFEWMFKYTSNVTLMEMSNINSPLLRELSESAPGTFQHSMQVSTLASAAAIKIGANALLARVGALYHDIGKTLNADYFTENQNNGVNPLIQMEAKDAVKIITNHVSDGLKIAEQHHMPTFIKDAIRTHHGSMPVRYFYTLYKNQHPQEPVPDYFFYPGPNPFSKETAILMMADSIEAASKSMHEYTEEGIADMVEKVIDTQIHDGAFRDAPITFREIEEIKEVMKERLHSIYHTRITYPQAKE